MRINIFILFLVVAFIYSCSPKYDVVRKTDFHGMTPPNCVWLRDSLYIDQTEIANFHYREYLYWLEKEFGYFSDEFQDALPDTLCWKNTLAYYLPYTQYYLRHPSYQNYPVVGISILQAEKFCEWRSHIVNEMIYNIQTKSENTRWDSTLYFKEIFQYRLPTKNEWEYAAYAGLDSTLYPFGYETLRTKKGYLKFNYKLDTAHRFTTSSDSFRLEVLTSPVYSFSPNKYGIYNMIGNVAELVGDYKFAKGGSYYHCTDSCNISCNINYLEPNSWLGFRCVAEWHPEDTIGSAAYHMYDWLRNDTLRIPLSAEKNRYDINITEFSRAEKLTDILILNPRDTILSYRVTITPSTGRELKDSLIIYRFYENIADSLYVHPVLGKPNTAIFDKLVYNNYFNVYLQDALSKINIGTVVRISEIRVKRNSKQLLYNGANIRIVG